MPDFFAIIFIFRLLGCPYSFAATRILALRDRGFALISISLGNIAFLVMTSKGRVMLP